MGYSYVDILTGVIVAVGFLFANLFIVYLLSPKNPLQGEKLETYECGELPFDDARVNFNIRYYIYALSFFIFDLEAIFLYPWAVVFDQLGFFGLMAMMMFLGIVTIGLLYEYKKGVLKWV